MLAACSREEAEVAEPAQASVPTSNTDDTTAGQASSSGDAIQEDADAQRPIRAPAGRAALLVAEASALEHNGYWHQALAALDSALDVEVGLSDEVAAALELSRIRLLLRMDRNDDAAAALAGLSATDERLNDDQVRWLTLLRAQLAMARSDDEVVFDLLEDYVNTSGPAWAVLSLEAAYALQRAGRGQEAIEWAERALDGLLPSQDRLRAIHVAATELDIGGDSDRALQRYDELLESSPWRDDQAAALSRIAVIQRDAGNLEAARAAWTRLVEDYSERAEAFEAVGMLLDAGADVDELSLGLIRFNQQRWVEARRALLNALGGSSVLADQVAGEFYIAAIHDENGDSESAALGYAAVIRRDATDPLAAESSMRLAEFALADGDTSAAEAQWRRVAEEQPTTRRASEAARRWAGAAVSRGDWSEAAQRYRDAANIGADHWGDDQRQEFLYWAALMSREAGDNDAAADLAAKTLAIDPAGYFGLRAAALSGVDSPSALDISISDWLVRLTGEADPPAQRLVDDAEWLAAVDLRLGGFDRAADRQLSAWVERLAGDPWALAQAAQLLSEQGEFTASVRAAEQLMALFGLDWTEAPIELLRYAYPQPWPEVMALHSGVEGVDPLLLWSLIRRESLYDADAEGLAGEVGLTQVIPTTGSDIALGLGIEYAHADLARPELSIRFGSWYLARQLEGFDSEPVMALAAYNAGPGNAARWEDAAPLVGVDGFLSALDYPSTRSYVQYVIETWAVYRAIAEVSSVGSG